MQSKVPFHRPEVRQVQQDLLTRTAHSPQPSCAPDPAGVLQLTKLVTTRISFATPKTFTVSRCRYLLMEVMPSDCSMENRVMGK